MTTLSLINTMRLKLNTEPINTTHTIKRYINIITTDYEATTTNTFF